MGKASMTKECDYEKGSRKLLELVLLEKAALLRWLQELEVREAQIRKWIADDAAVIEKV